MNVSEEDKKRALGKVELMKEFVLYDFQYREAIYKLMNNSSPQEYIYPLLALIHQLIENQLKMSLIECTNNRKTLKELKVENTHNLKTIVEREEFFIYYDEIEKISTIYNEYRKYVIYFYEILGEDTFLNSRYPIERFENIATVKNKIDYKELYENWTKYSLLSYEIGLIRIAYSYSNTIFYLLEHGLEKEKIKEEMKGIIIETCMGVEEMTKKVLEYLDLYIKRNKHIDYGYVC